MRHKRTLGMLGAVGLAVTTGSLVPGQVASADMKDDAMKMMANWSMDAQKAAKGMMEIHGAPDEATATMLVWHNKGPWKRIIASSTTTMHNFPGPHPDSVEQFLNYKVPESKHDEIARFDGSVNIDRTRGEMSARCDAQTHNILALNLAHDIIMGKRSVEGARAFYARAIKIEKMQHQLHHYMLRLNFTPMASTADPDHVDSLLRPMVRKMRDMGKM